MIQFTCGKCKKSYNVQDKYAGKRVKCKQCQEVCIVPDAGATGRGDSLQAFNNLISELGKDEAKAPPLEEEDES
ncbi:MAG: hypothetical protein ACYTET_02685 [Planctomycetota bacterium]